MPDTYVILIDGELYEGGLSYGAAQNLAAAIQQLIARTGVVEVMSGACWESKQ